mmetsp:Transcript_16904/g.28124  ORF Transcript_16904/g.28124 Transcript_16904/m.28124 type:complete len:566 (-) Transcript_16904:284-1981(-)|eukprot:CAMPEP_0119317502 /NCGR_PEP_ID=MMETSP1333-20130426/43335_1 /TAXON_ID=418940 /ORGANISM="Scyphosphaera apsteinii, Strain RCC1455" /LENGTH=565 /DNA_ID=CAMNT_0007323443 /DNA_START=145 /DNA_END=1842 /DNA_ORIENTATION=+
MKFGKDLLQYKAAGWEQDYIDYKGLKSILKKLQPDSGSPASKEEVDAEFFQELEENLEKVNRAFLERCNELETALELTTNRSRGVSRISSSISLEEVGSLSISDPPGSATQEANDVAGSSVEGESYNNAPFSEQELKSREERTREFYEAYKTLGRLQTFVWINAKGFEKIIKKYDKRQNLRGTGMELGPEFEKRLEKEAFCSGKMEVLTELFKSRRPGTIVSVPSQGGPGEGRGDTALHMQLLTGNANPELAGEISARLGIPLTPARIGKFADGEVSIQILENVRNADVYIIQPTSPPVNDNLMELLLCASACRRAAAARVTAVVPYYGYARQDRKERSRVPISAADVAKMMEAMGIDRVCCVDLHCGQIQGFFGPRTPVDNLWATPIAISYFSTRQLDNIAVVSPDAGGVARAKMFREGIEAQGQRASLAMIIQQRGPDGEVGQTDLVGTVNGCDCIIVDDIVDTARTLCSAADELITFGARRVFAFATHGLFNGLAAAEVEASRLEELVVTNTIPLPSDVYRVTRKVRQVSVGKLLATAIKCISTGDSVSSLFDVARGDNLLA